MALMTANSGIWGLPRMDAKDKALVTRFGTLRVAASVALVSVALGGCSSVPDAVNPVKWYDKTTDFFAGDQTAADVQPTAGENQGLAADPNAPPPATPDQEVAQAQGGLSADAGSRQYAGEAIARQGAPSDVLRPESEVAAAPPPPVAQPTMPVTTPQPVPTPQPITAMDQAAPPRASASAPAPVGVPERPASMSMEGAPPPPTFNLPANAQDPYAADTFETVVIGSDGMQTESAPRMALPTRGQSSSQVQDSGAMFPVPGTTTNVQNHPQAPMMAGMTRVATIHFANGASNLDARDRSILGAVIQLQRERGGRVVVVGHASSRTRNMDYISHQMANFEISMERASSIGNVLKDMGLVGEALEIQAVSDTQPMYLEVMPSGEAGNRRVEIYLAAG